MSERVAEPEDMYAPGDYVIVIEFVHVFPNKLVVFSESKGVNVKFRSSSKNVGFGAGVFEFIFGKDLYSYRIDSVVLFVGKVDDNLLETVVRSAIEFDWFVWWFVSYKSHMGSSELEELRMGSFLAF